MSATEMKVESIVLGERWKLYTQSGVDKRQIKIRGRKLFIDSRLVGEVVDGDYEPVKNSLQTMSYPSVSQAPSFGDFYGALLPVMDDWKKIGTLLGCNFPTLNDIQRRERDDALCLMEMLAERQKIHEPPLSWDLIISAVQPFNSFEAENIRRKQQVNTVIHL